jgi:vacuolar protein sorting-associated protein VTA1
MLMDVLSTFGDLSEDIEKNHKYAKWKAAYIHNCLKNGETPVSGPMADESSMGDVDNELTGKSVYSDNQLPISQPTPAPRTAPSATPLLPQTQISSAQPVSVNYTSPAGAVGGSVNLKSEDYSKAMKLCKFATSALQYEDAKTAIENLTKALNLLTTGHE